MLASIECMLRRFIEPSTISQKSVVGKGFGGSPALRMGMRSSHAPAITTAPREFLFFHGPPPGKKRTCFLAPRVLASPFGFCQRTCVRHRPDGERRRTSSIDVRSEPSLKADIFDRAHTEIRGDMSWRERNSRATFHGPLFGKALVERTNIDNNPPVSAGADLFHPVGCRYLEVDPPSFDLDYLSCRLNVTTCRCGSKMSHFHGSADCTLACIQKWFDGIQCGVFHHQDHHGGRQHLRHYSVLESVGEVLRLHAQM